MSVLVNEWNEGIRKGKPPFTLPATVRFVQFNFDNGTVSMHDHVFPDKGTKPPSRSSQILRGGLRFESGESRSARRLIPRTSWRLRKAPG